MAKYTLRCNENLNIEILELHYVQGMSIKKLIRKFKQKLGKSSIYSIISEHKLYKEYKEWKLGFT